MFKHLFLYIAPVVFIYLLSAVCFPNGRFHIRQFSLLGMTVLTVFTLAFGPFLNHLPQVFRRLFPFQRGLCHAYWAPNFWALYLFFDRCFGQVSRIFAPTIDFSHSSTRGLVGDINFHFLPTIHPIHTFMLSVILMSPFLFVLWKRSGQWNTLIHCILLCGFVSFLVGWHVHEKAILTVWVPFSLVALDSLKLAQTYFFFSILSTYSLFPLLFEPLDTALCWSLLATFHAFLYTLFYCRYQQVKPQDGFIVPKPVVYYTLFIIPLECFRHFIHPLFLKETLPFLPLMLISTYCAFGFLCIFGYLSYTFFQCYFSKKEKKKLT
ncbi:glycosyl transferase [Coelomomyces lativittatus]|nr:glycosyl transferase [Coelomomyces lativittatus]KAJ1510098.1 glycosyl transferase [Coelomomyces lativittatus]KAJ1518294.1 glycosyl transferase [Coelomomyces lativittatus]